MQPPLVSIIIPTYNRAHLIGETLESVLAQTYTNWECIVVDDGSTDDTGYLLKNYNIRDARFQYYHRPKDRLKGANACRNYGFELSEGNYILFLDSDDIIKPTCIKGRLNIFMTSSTIDFVVANTALLLDGFYQKESLNNDPKIKTREHYLLAFLSYNLPWTSTLSVLWKKTSISNISFDESLLRLQDVDFHIRVLMNAYEIGRLNEIDNYYRIEKNKVNNKQHIASVLNNLLPLMIKCEVIYASNSIYREAFRQFGSHFLFEYIYPHYRYSNKEVKALLKHLYVTNLYTNYQKGLIKLKELLILYNLNQVKNIGMYKLNKFIKNQLEKG